MTIEENDRESLIKYRLEQASETILDVELLVENKRLRSVIMKDFFAEISSLIRKS